MKTQFKKKFLVLLYEIYKMSIFGTINKEINFK